MAWLIAQMWFWLLTAAVFGGLVGWSLRARRKSAGAVRTTTADVAAIDAQAQIAELTTQLQQERDALKRQREQMAVGSVSTEIAGGEADREGSVAWRNRYLESRVRFLEGKLADLEAAAAPRSQPAEADDEATRLRWRNRYLEGRVRYLEEEMVRGERIVVSPPEPPTSAAAKPAFVADGALALQERPIGIRPATLNAARNGKADNLQQIAGIGPKLEAHLNTLGIYHFDQIASWTPEEVDWVNSAIAFRGRIEREKWVAQAAQFAQKTGVG